MANKFANHRELVRLDVGLNRMRDIRKPISRYGLLDASSVLEQAALDRYAFVRSSYAQHRQNLVENKDGGKPVPAASFGGQ